MRAAAIEQRLVLRGTPCFPWSHNWYKVNSYENINNLWHSPKYNLNKLCSIRKYSTLGQARLLCNAFANWHLVMLQLSQCFAIKNSIWNLYGYIIGIKPALFTVTIFNQSTSNLDISKMVWAQNQMACMSATFPFIISKPWVELLRKFLLRMKLNIQ